MTDRGRPDRNDSQDRPERATAGITVVLAVLASLCATAVSYSLKAPPPATWLGAALGAAVPPLITTAGPRHSLRVSVGIAVALGAFILTFGGVTGAAVATDSPSPFAKPKPRPTPTPTPARAAGTSGPASPSIGTPKPGIDVTPNELPCTADTCSEPVTITSTGTAALVLGEIEFDGAAAGMYRHDGTCSGRKLRRGDQCTLTVTFDPGTRSGTRRARLVIHQNLSGPPTYVPLIGKGPEGTSSGRLPDLVITTQGCGVVPDGGLKGGDVLSVYFRVRSRGSEPYQGRVSVTADSDSGFHASVVGVAVEDKPSSHSFQVEFAGQDYGRTHTFTLVTTPETQVEESSLANNSTTVTVTLPEVRPTKAFFPCR